MNAFEKFITKLNETGFEMSMNVGLKVIQFSARCLARHEQLNAKPENLIDAIIANFIASGELYGFNDTFKIITDEQEGFKQLKDKLRYPPLDMIFKSEAKNPNERTRYYVSKDKDGKYAVPVVYRANRNGNGIAVMAFATIGDCDTDIDEEAESMCILPTDEVAWYLYEFGMRRIAKGFVDIVNLIISRSHDGKYEVKDVTTVPNLDYDESEETGDVKDAAASEAPEDLKNRYGGHSVTDVIKEEAQVPPVDSNVKVDVIPNASRIAAELQDEAEPEEGVDVEAAAPAEYFNTDESNAKEETSDGVPTEVLFGGLNNG